MYQVMITAKCFITVFQCHAGILFTVNSLKNKQKLAKNKQLFTLIRFKIKTDIKLIFNF